MPELPDWTKGTVLLGKYGDTYLAIATDAAGQMYVLTVGIDGTETTRVLRTDDEGQLIIVPRGADGNYLAVDADGFLAAIMKGQNPDTDLVNVSVDDDGQLIMVPRGAGGNYLDVDANGFLTTVIKGDYEGSLRTVRMDDDGRLSAFVIDSVDAWGNMLSVGNAELAARLGSGVLFDQRGRVQLYEDFSEGGPRWVTTLQGTGADAELIPDTFIKGGYCYKLTGGSDGNKYARIHATFGANTSGQMGISVSFTTGGNIDYIKVAVTVQDGSYMYVWGMIYDHTNLDFEYLNNAGSGSKIGDAEANDATIYQWNHFKIVADIDTGYYIRALFNDTEYDCSTYQFFKLLSSSNPLVTIEVYAYSRTGNNDVAYVDNIIFTTAEPD